MLYVMQVLSGEESKVQHMLEAFVLEDGEEIFSPTCEREYRSHGEIKEIIRKLFPGYLFIKTVSPLDLHLRLYEVKTKHFIETLTKLLRSDDLFLPLTTDEEHTVLSLLDTEHHMGMSRGVIHDGTLHIFSGPLVGKEAAITKIDRHKRIAILRVRLCGRDVSLQSGLEIIEKT